MSDYVRTMQSGIKTIPWPRQMEALFGEGDHILIHYGTETNSKDWHSTVYFYGRYSLTMTTEVRIDWKERSVQEVLSAPKFYLHEVEAIIRDSVGPGASFSHQWIINETDWDKLVKAKGDWSALGIPVRTNDPVPDFDAYVKACRAPIERIPH